jgi:polar amino acid transport system permease protein
MFEREILETVIPRLADGFVVTLEIFFLTLLISLPVGLIISFGSMSKFKPLKYAAKTLVAVIRGTPLVLQLIVIFYGPGLIAAWAQSVENPNFIIEWMATWHVMDRFVAVIVSFSLNYACYFSEIYRGGIESISKGQYEACQVLGMTKTQTFFKVVLMQLVKRIIPPMSNEIITLVKDTSLARVIAVAEILMTAERYAGVGVIWPLFYTGAFFLLACGLLTILFNKIEKKLSFFSV